MERSVTSHHHKCSIRIYGVCDCPVAAADLAPPPTAQEMINAANSAANAEAESREYFTIARRGFSTNQDDPEMMANMRLIAAAPEMLELLLELESIDIDGLRICPSCEEGPRHDPDCKLAALLKRIDERRGSDPMT